jgi:hypothetical protein
MGKYMEHFLSFDTVFYNILDSECLSMEHCLGQRFRCPSVMDLLK